MNQIECIEFASLLGVVISQLGQDGEQKRVRECFHFLFYRKYYFFHKIWNCEKWYGRNFLIFSENKLQVIRKKHVKYEGTFMRSFFHTRALKLMCGSATRVGGMVRPYSKMSSRGNIVNLAVVYRFLRKIINPLVRFN